ncbi:HNH endonuclease [Candidatus Promineifilum breve]|uniref:HNH endonuclease n=1 Tax=Candidatus Promineifilum breve TaxID=1806508 RepID=A0A160T1H3_9CHLR|nr:HNH endonuclease signature motif containing protein [Candidatus Promineifilum breve]CUS03332.2 HNH endonuclease [Candidatus Promineifilum breve]
MERATFEGHFYETYYFANIVRNVLHDQISYLRLLDNFYGADPDFEFAQPFPKYSAFHKFIEFLVTEIINDEVFEIELDVRQDTFERYSHMPIAMNDLRPTSLPIEKALIYYNIEHTSFVDWLKNLNKEFLDADDNDVSDYYDELTLEGPFETLVESAVREVFFILFQNRGLMLLFNEMMAGLIFGLGADTLEGECDSFFAKPGVLKRAHIPRWVQRAVYFRDRGLCVICQRDLSGIINISSIEHYDHIVPLAQGGLNDVSNIQLLCQDCNLKKRNNNAQTSSLYEAWYPMND